MNDFKRPFDVLRSHEAALEYSSMSEESLLAERERLLLLKRRADEATDFDSWSKKDQDEAVNASKMLYEVQEALNRIVSSKADEDMSAAAK